MYAVYAKNEVACVSVRMFLYATGDDVAANCMSVGVNVLGKNLTPLLSRLAALVAPSTVKSSSINKYEKLHSSEPRREKMYTNLSRLFALRLSDQTPHTVSLFASRWASSRMYGDTR